MRILWQAIRAATIETLGVVLLIVALFGVPTWTLTENSSIVPQEKSVRMWLESLRDGRHAVAKPEVEARQRYAEQRLSHYSRTFGRAASGCVKRVASEVVAGPQG
ncbi:MAG: hypothetical protein ACC628_09315 [Pirellulaceae bacterium]